MNNNSNPYWSIKSVSLIIVLLSLIIIHGLFDDIFKIDTVSVLLLAMLILSPYLSLIKKIKFGDFEAEISNDEVKNIEKQVQKIPNSQHSDVMSNKTEELIEIAESDHVLALAKVRIEIERRVRFLGEIYLKNKPAGFFNLSKIIRELLSEGFLENPLATLLNNIISVGNRAIHGELVSKESAMNLVESSIRAISELDNVVINQALKTVNVKQVTANEVNSLRDGDYVLKTIVPYVEKPEMRTYHLNQTELDVYLEGYDNTGEFIISLDKKQSNK